MGDYPTDEQLTRLLAIERMRQLSNWIIEAISNGDAASARAFNEERAMLKQQYIKVVK